MLALTLSLLLAGTASPEPAVVLYAVRLNAQEVGEARLLRFSDGRLMARRLDLEEWRLRAPEVTPFLFLGEEHFAIDAFAGAVWKVDEARQELTLDVPPRHFRETVIDPAVSSAAPQAPPLGGFANYDLLASATNHAKQLDGSFEAGVFSGLGVGATTFLSHSAGPQSGIVRLETKWTRDFPDEARTLIIGDTPGASGLWGRPVNFGGVRYGTNFATTPGFVPFPMPALKGEAAMPTTTDLYVDGVLRKHSSLPPGPFQVNEVPVVSGQGEVRLVTQDLMGRERVLTQPYYASPRLLRRGLTDESYEAGFVRDNYGLRSNEYGRFVAMGQRRTGLTDSLTGEVRAELLRHQQTVGTGATLAVPGLGLFTAGGAVSRATPGAGAQFFSAFERQSRRGLNFALSWQWSSPAFVQLGLQPGQAAPLRVLTAFAGLPLGEFGSLGLSYVRRDTRDRPGNEIVSASYSVTIARSVALSVSAFRSVSGEPLQSFVVGLSTPFGDGRTAYAGYTRQPRSDQAVLQVQQNLPAGPGAGYRVLAEESSSGRHEEGALSLQSDEANYEVAAARGPSYFQSRAGMSGSVVLVGGRPFLMRRMVDSFGVVEVPGFADVAVSVNNQVVGRTNGEGYVVLPHLMPYQANAVRIEPSDLPIDAQIDASRLEAVPWFRSGLTLRFPVKRSNGALVVVVLEDGTPVPPGAVVRIEGGVEEFPVVDRGEVYVTGLAKKNKLRVVWQGRSCVVDIELNDDLPALPKLGPLVCAGKRP